MQQISDQLQIFDVKNYQITLTSFVEDFPVSHFESQDYEVALKIPEVLSFLKLYGFYDITKIVGTQSPVLFSKMLKVYLATMMEKHLLSFTEFLPTLITPLSANCLILVGFYPKIESEFTLSDILEENPDEKYFLSEKQVNSLTTGIQESKLLQPSNHQEMPVETIKE